ncbi:hypothetical protein EJD97_007536 [Solanum chilense]|uniref:Uncharacterized protein n=1 Tax=Solanum chilense TaxID=4083 RepID=A0A6N2BNR5_SOLCI|nr:hypothetical protein EJD97_007536 [Solanum chilense]
MVFISNKAFVFLLICIGLLVVCSHSQQQNELRLSTSRRMLKGLVTEEELNTGFKSAPVSKTFDPNGSSKRKVRKGSDPIHNRS